MSSKRRHFSAEQKAQVVRRHLAGKEAVSNLADEFQIQPSLIHLWVKQVLEQAERAFDKAPGKRALAEASARRIEQLQNKLVQKNEVIAELMEENVRAKKATGEL
jgi:transposase-like protein